MNEIIQKTTPYEKKIHRGDIGKITIMLQGKYARRTVQAQLTGERTLKDEVKAAADRYFETLEKLYQNTEQ
jgi:hypothetical protein